MNFEKQCKTCEFNSSGICIGYGSTFKYGAKITDETKGCEGWGANLEYFDYITANAPRFLREQYNDCRISYDEFISLLTDYIGGKGVPINIFDAIKFIYGITMVDIAVLLNVSFGVVYRAKTIGIPSKRVKQFADALCISPALLTSITTQNFNSLRESREKFFSQPNIEQRINSLPEWKQNLASIICANYLHCPIHHAKEIARVDKMYWTSQMPMDNFTESEIILINFVAHNNKYRKPALSLEYSLDLTCTPHMSLMLYNGNDTK